MPGNTHEQPRPSGIQTALDEALQQPERDHGVLARPLPNAQDPLVAIPVHAERREDVVAAELDAVHVDDQIVPVVQPPLRQLPETLPRRLGRPAADRGLAAPAVSAISPTALP